MRKIDTTPLTYMHDSTKIFEKLLSFLHPIFLDSCHKKTNHKIDIISANPFITLKTLSQKTYIHINHKEIVSEEDPFELIKKYLPKIDYQSNEYPFIGGAIGYFSYDLARRIENLPEISDKDIDIPDMFIGIYDWAIINDHLNKKTTLVCSHQDRNSKTLINDIKILLDSDVDLSVNNRVKLKKSYNFTSNFTKTTYEKAFYKIKNYIKNGDCYQVNLAQRFKTSFDGDTWNLYKTLREKNPAPFSAYLHYPFADILSSSPERFLKVHNHNVETCPIKGTRKRHQDPIIDKQLAEELANSQKDKAENLMIVDLLRNDLSKCCIPGSVKVPKLFSLESFATVHHLVSTVTGILSDDNNSVDLLQACFPGGSITGAPKVRAMEIIEECEPHRRNLYCGSIGYISYHGNMDTNIVIRTLTSYEKNLYCYAGGGLVADSHCEDEYEETLTKASALLKAVEEFSS